MTGLLKSAAKALTPPVVWNSLRYLLVAPERNDRPTVPEGEPGEQDAAWYDASFHAAEHFRRHYSASPYYFLWCVIWDRLRRAAVRSVLDVGCGSGQLAALLRDRGLKTYCGVDFSEARIEWARKTCPQFDFVLGDVFETDVFETFEYDTVICTEFLEHVERDLDALERTRRGARLYATVPNFPFASHVRHFTTCDEVRSRYAALLRDLDVVPVLANEEGKTFFLLEGIRI